MVDSYEPVNPLILEDSQMKVFKPNFEKRKGLVAVVTTEKASGAILMLAYANEEAWRLTLQTGCAHYYSTS
ncbi:MAG: hypothetical protein WCX61_05505, partial [Candidatus Peribacteraceae bacterium]